MRCLLIIALLCGVAAIGLAAPVVAMAQQPANLEEVVVTAQRRSERLQDVPISVIAVTGKELAAVGVQTSRDLTLIHLQPVQRNRTHQTPMSLS